jgi:CRP/FNR family transcriptional regulator, cyclic AMP receptor protein
MDGSTAALLKQVRIFEALDEHALSALSARTRRRRFAAGHTLFHEGDPGQTLYVIVSGRVHIQRATSTGEILHLAYRGPGEPFGELALIDGKPRMADAITAEPSDVLVLDRAEFIRCVEEMPRIALAVMGCLADRLREAADHFELYQSQDVLGRVSAAILELLTLHGVPEASGAVRIQVRVTQQDIADQTGATRESVNRALARLKQVEILQIQGRQLVVTDVAKLRRYCQR